MYNFPLMREANAMFWKALSSLLRTHGITDAPAQLEFEHGPVPDRIAAETLFSQTCGYPLQTIYQGQYRLLAAPDYDAPGCGEMTHSAFIVVRAKDDAGEPADLRGRRFAMNTPHSNSGMNLPRLLFAPLARNGAFFDAVTETGSHPKSLAMVQAGRADAASVDCLTWAFAAQHAPEMIDGLRVLAQTAPSPTIPFITAASTPPQWVTALSQSLEQIGREADYSDARAGLRIRDIRTVGENAYTILRDYVRQAEDLGYPVLN